ncbi:hypothetical protein BGZ58_008149 [Dissophora ornata]|nr:hypothetical protein BGZ58_008149 [Dissophora ornata]
MFMLAASITMFVQAVNGFFSSAPSWMQVAGTSTMGTVWLCALVVNYNEHKYTIRSSNSLFTFYIMSILTTGLLLHTQLRLKQTARPEYHLSITSLVLLTMGFTVEAWPRGSTRVQQQSNAQDFEKANLFSQLTFHFFQPIVSLAAKQQMLYPSDIFNQLPESYMTKPGYAHLSTCWGKRVQRYRDKVVLETKRSGGTGDKIKSVKKPSLMTTILIANWKALVPVVIVRIAIPVTEYLSPALLGLLLDYIDNPNGRLRESMSSFSATPRNIEEKPLMYGLVLAFSIFAIRITVPMLYSYVLRDMYLLSTGIKAALVAMIYRKSLKLSPDAKRKSSTGAITNHMSVDAVLWEEGIDKLSVWISLPFDFTICLAMLYNLLGWSFLAGLLTILALIPLQLWRAGVYEGLEEERLKATDERVRLTSEVLASVKIVKLYGWESAFKKKISGARNVELGVLRRMGALESIMSVVFASSSVIVSLVTFATYVTIGKGELTPKIVFVSMTLFDLLHEPVSRLAEGTTDTIGLVVATKRIQRFLFREEIDDTQIIREKYNKSGSENVIEIQDATLSWTSRALTSEDDDENEEDERENNESTQGSLDATEVNVGPPVKPALQNINLTVRDKTLTAVVGRVGQGKSSLLSAIIGEMYKLQGTIRVAGRIAYVPQQAWIFNATLRDNILFGNAFDQDRYRQVLKACGLEPDLAILPAGDLTEIGERGINLSGGQKQRVSLARATYDNADVYLMDDPLSAVDAHVDRHLWDNLIGSKGLLKDKARILVTHGIGHLEHVDQIVVISDGQISEIGQYNDLIGSKQSFYQLMEYYSAKQWNSHAPAIRTETVGDSNCSVHHACEPASTDGPSEESEDSGMESENVAVDYNQASEAHTLDEEEDELIAEEIMKKGGIEWKLVKNYAKACTLKIAIGIVLINIVTQLCTLGFSLWLKYWISKTKEELRASLVLFLGVYAVMTAVYVVFYVIFVRLALAVGRIRASELIHRRLISTIVRLPLSIDEHLPWKFMDLIYLVINVTMTMVLIAVTTPVFVLLIPAIAAVYYVIQRYFLWATRSLKRINSVSFSPLYQHFDETLSGVSTIRAMAVQQQFIEENAKRTDYNANAHTAYMYCNRWVDLRLETLSAIIVLVVALSGVFGRFTVDPSLIGLSLNFALNATESIMWLCRDFSEWQSHLVAIERVQEYTEKRTEAPEATDGVVSERWPDQGRVIFKNYSTRYREGLDLVLKHLSFEVLPGESVGIVGRTGAGKSSLTLALFRIIEAANSYWARASDNTGYHTRHQEGETENDPLLDGLAPDYSGDEDMDGGSIEIDGVDISTLGLADLRKHLAIIPQDPTLFGGTIRDNLDPFQELQDSDLWEALERAHLKSHVRGLPGGLSAEVAQNGENFSLGQRSLICLARALLRKSKILILDEATAAVDVETDELIQRTIREEFRDRTILTIAHRIKTVMDSSKILVMDQGRVVEFDAPGVLLQKPESLFFKLAHQAGEISM